MPTPRAGAIAVLLVTPVRVRREDAAARRLSSSAARSAPRASRWAGDRLVDPDGRGAAQTNLPVAAKGATATSPTDAVLLGGDGDGTLYWTAPDADGIINGWDTLTRATCRRTSGCRTRPARERSHAFLFGGTAPERRRRGSPAPAWRLPAVLPARPLLHGAPCARIQARSASSSRTWWRPGRHGELRDPAAHRYAYNHPQKTKLFFNRIRAAPPAA